MKTSWLKWLLIVAVALSPRLATAQCSMGGAGGGGHDHGAATRASGSKSNEKKTRQSIERLLAEPRARELLMEAVLADPGLMRGLVDRIAATPEFRALVVERLAAAGAAPAPKDTTALTRPVGRPPADAALYRCPMHAEVTARQPGRCPKCGMALERVT